MKVSVVVPTYKEFENIPQLAKNIHRVLNGRLEEILIVDDNSSDGIEEWQRSTELPITLIVRREKRGLGSAILKGLREARSDNVIVMDADGQHPPIYLPNFYVALQHHDMVVGSRYIKYGGTLGWKGIRPFASRALSLLGWPVSGLRDSTSGFFAINKEKVNLDGVEVEGFKVCLELASKVKSKTEIPYCFIPRVLGTSKLGSAEVIQYFKQLGRLYWRKFDLTRMTKYSIIGSCGLAIHTFILWVLTDLGGLYYLISNLGAAALTMLFNFTMNKKWTFRR